MLEPDSHYVRFVSPRDSSSELVFHYDGRVGFQKRTGSVLDDQKVVLQRHVDQVQAGRLIRDRSEGV